MADRQLIYTVALQTGQALQQAQTLKQAFEQQLKAVQVTPDMRATATAQIEGEKRLTATTRAEAQARVQAARAEANARTQQARAAAEAAIQQERRITAQAQTEARIREQATQAPTAPTGGAGFGGIGRGVAGVALGYLGLQGAQSIINTAKELDQLRGRTIATNTALTSLAGGATQARSAIASIREVAPGATSALAAAESATVILTQKLPSAAVSLKEIAQFAAIVPQISASISDSGDALAQLTLFASSSAFARADQLGVTAQDVKDRMKELADTYPELSDAQVKAAATVQLVNERFSPLAATMATNVTGVQQLTSAWADLRAEIAQDGIGEGVNTIFEDIAEATQLARAVGGSDDLQAQIDALNRLKENAQVQGVGLGAFGPLSEVTGANQLTRDNIAQYEQASSLLKGLQEQIAAGVPIADQYLERVQAIATEIARAPFGPSEDQIARLQEAVSAVAEARFLAEETQGAEVDFGINEQAAALDELESISARITDAYAQADAAVRNNIPGAQEYRSALIQLATDIASGNGTIEEQAAALSELESWFQFSAEAADILTTAQGGAAGASTTMGSQAASAADLVAILGDESLTAAEKVTALKLAMAGIAGIQAQVDTAVSRVDAAVLSASKKLIPLVGAQGATDYFQENRADELAIKRLQQEFPDPAEFQLRLEALIETQTAGADAQIEAAQEAERAQKKAASESERAFKKAAQAAEEAWQDAANDLKSGLESTPGLLGTSSVTEEQLTLAKGGVPQNFADNFIRRLEDEINTKKDLYPDVSIDKAREALQRVGIIPGETVEATLIQLRQAWESSALFAHPANLELIDQAAVKENLALQEKAEQGQKNIYQFFANSIDEALKPFLPGGERLAKPGGLPEGYSVDADGNVVEPLGPMGGIDDIQLERLKNLPNTIIESALGEVDKALASGGIAGLGGGGGVAGGYAAGVEGAPGIQQAGGLTLTPTIAPISPEALAAARTFITENLPIPLVPRLAVEDIAPESFELAKSAILNGLPIGIVPYLATDQMDAEQFGGAAGSIIGGIAAQLSAQSDLIEGQGADIARVINSGLAGFDFSTSSTGIILAVRNGFSTEDNLDKMAGIGGGIAEFIRMGLAQTVNQPEWAEPIASQIATVVLQALQAEFEADQ